MKKLIFVSSQFGIGGIETSFCNLARYCLVDKYELELHLVNQQGEIKVNIPHQVKVVRMKSRADLLYRGKNRSKTLRVLQVLGVNRFRWFNNYLYREIPISDCDVCFLLKENDPIIYYVHARVNAAKYVAFFHTPLSFGRFYAHFYESRFIDKIITVSEGNKNFLCKKMPLSTQKMIVVHNVLKPDEIRAKAQEFCVDVYENSCFNLLTVGRICNKLGIQTILRTAVILKEQGLCYKWYILGPKEGQYDKGGIEELLNDYQLANHILLLDPTMNPFPYMLKADVLINPSLKESFGMCIRESQILGVPVIASRTHGGIELIKDGITGILFDIDNEDQLASKILMLKADERLYTFIRGNLDASNYDETDDINSQLNDIIEN